MWKEVKLGLSWRCLHTNSPSFQVGVSESTVLFHFKVVYSDSQMIKDYQHFRSTQTNMIFLLGSVFVNSSGCIIGK